MVVVIKKMLLMYYLKYSGVLGYFFKKALYNRYKYYFHPQKTETLFTPMNRKTIAYIACSIDGFIAKPGDDLSFLDKMQVEGEDYGYKAFTDRVDTVILGNNTYQWVMKQVNEFPHANKETFVITRQEKPSQGHVHFYTGDLQKLILSLKSKPGGNVFIDGGGRTISELLKLRCLDEIHLFLVPILLGEGTRLFQGNYPEQTLELFETRSFSSGMVSVKYRVVKAQVESH